MPSGTAVFQTSDVQVDEKKGDMNGDGHVNLTDAVLAMKVVASMNVSGLLHPRYAVSEVDVNGDNRIGIGEVIYVLKGM